MDILESVWQSYYAFHALQITDAESSDSIRRGRFNAALESHLLSMQFSKTVPDRSSLERWCSDSYFKLMFGADCSGECSPRHVVDVVLSMDTTSQLLMPRSTQNLLEVPVLDVQGIVFDNDLSERERALLGAAIKLTHVSGAGASLVHLARVPRFPTTTENEVAHSVKAAKRAAKLRVIRIAEMQGLANFSKLDKALTSLHIFLARL